MQILRIMSPSDLILRSLLAATPETSCTGLKELLHLLCLAALLPARGFGKDNGTAHLLVASVKQFDIGPYPVAD